MEIFRRSRFWIFCISAGIAALLVLAPVLAADSVTRGRIFTVSIAGKPVTAYYVWFTGTSSMTGEPGDQPPVIVANTDQVEFDPDGGPYGIGSYQYYNGNGRTILEDVAPSSETVSNTRYYAKVTTDSDGFGIIGFQTSSATADRTFTIKAQNPASPQEEVPVKLGLPTRKTAATTATTSIRETAAPLPEVTVFLPATTPPLLQTTTETVPAQTSLPTTSRQAPLFPAGAVAAVIAGMRIIRRAS